MKYESNLENIIFVFYYIHCVGAQDDKDEEERTERIEITNFYYSSKMVTLTPLLKATLVIYTNNNVT